MDQLAITFITATTALVAGIAGPIVSLSVARRQIKASVISNNRERWNEALRDSIAEYVALVTSVALIERGGGGDLGEIVRANQELREKAERMLLVRSKILLMTNPNNSFHNGLCESIEAVHAALMSNQTLTLQEWRSHLEAITLAGHAVLKAEWARVKRGD
jgi:hypothetical protein